MSKQHANLFLSHKSEDAAAARIIKKTLEDRSSHLHIHIFEELPGGSDWQDWIAGALAEADVLVLLYSDPTSEWDWCMYEAGWFTPLRTAERRPIICLHGEGNAPRPLASLTGVALKRDQLVEKFLHPLFKTTELVPLEEPLLETLSVEAMEEDADKILAAFKPAKITPHYYLSRIKIDIDRWDIDDAGNKQVPSAATVTALDGRLDSLEIDDAVFSWSDLERRASETKGYGTYWLSELEAALVRGSEKRPPEVLTGTFRGLRRGLIYRPILFRIDRANGTPRSYYVAFNEEVEPELVGGPGKTGLMFNLLRLANRFRWEVIGPFSKRFGRASKDIEMRVAYRQMMESVKAIEDEAQRHRHLEQDGVLGIFEEPGTSEVRRMLERWSETRASLEEQRDPSLQDKPALLEALDDLRQMNQRFLVLTAEAYLRRVQEEARVAVNT